MQSFRWIQEAALEVDAYLLEDGKWFLFAYAKGPAPEWGSLRSQWLAQFPDCSLAGIGGASKGSKSEPLEPAPGTPPVVWAVEAGSLFRLETKAVLNPGLFLDQRLNRARLAAKVGAQAESSILNLFSYTGSFSIAAAAAGAAHCTSVDLSRRYLRWEQENFSRWELGGGHCRHQHIVEDARKYLERAERTGKRYSFIVIDPPTFARSPRGTFQVQRDLPSLVALGCQILENKGALFVAANDGRWMVNDFANSMREIASEQKRSFIPGEAPPEFGPRHNLKSAWLE